MSGKSAVLTTLLGVSLLAFLAGCYGVSGGVGIDVGVPPPGLRAEVAVTSPGEGYYWVPGYWDWVGAEWSWVPGAWARPPHVRAVWVAPRYERGRRGHWRYIRGRWR